MRWQQQETWGRRGAWDHGRSRSRRSRSAACVRDLPRIFELHLNYRAPATRSCRNFPSSSPSSSSLSRPSSFFFPVSGDPATPSPDPVRAVRPRVYTSGQPLATARDSRESPPVARSQDLKPRTPRSHSTPLSTRSTPPSPSRASPTSRSTPLSSSRASSSSRSTSSLYSRAWSASSRAWSTSSRRRPLAPTSNGTCDPGYTPRVCRSRPCAIAGRSLL